MVQDRPKCLTEEHLLYLDRLRESGVTNMFGAVPYIQLEFPDLSEQEAKQVLVHWMKSFSDRHPERGLPSMQSMRQGEIDVEQAES